MTVTRSLGAALLAALTLGPAAAAQVPPPPPPPPPGAVATVGDTVITQERYDRWKRTTDKRAEVMSFLIEAAWVTGEARTRGIEVAPERVRRAVRRQKREVFKSERQYRRYLRRSRLTPGQVRFRVKLDLLQGLLVRSVAATAEPVTRRDVDAYIRANRRELRGLTKAERRRKVRRLLLAGRQQAAVESFVYDFRHRWRALTVCAPGYVVPECGNQAPPASAAPTSSSASGLRA